MVSNARTFYTTTTTTTPPLQKEGHSTSVNFSILHSHTQQLCIGHAQPVTRDTAMAWTRSLHYRTAESTRLTVQSPNAHSPNISRLVERTAGQGCTLPRLLL